jgi:hypothetical protein
MKKNKSLPGYIYWMTLGALLIAAFAAAVACDWVQLGEKGLHLNFPWL